MNVPRFQPGDRVRIPELGNVVGTLEASRQGTRLVGPHYTRAWCVSLPSVESYIWIDEYYLRLAEEGVTP